MYIAVSQTTHVYMCNDKRQIGEVDDHQADPPVPAVFGTPAAYLLFRRVGITTPDSSL